MAMAGTSRRRVGGVWPALGVVIAILGGTPPAMGQLDELRGSPEHSLFPGAEPLPYFALGRNAARDCERLGLKGRVRAVKLMFESVSEEPPRPPDQEVSWLMQGNGLSISFDEGGFLVSITMDDDLGDSQELRVVHQLEGHGETRRSVRVDWKEDVTPENSAGVECSQTRAYDESGRLTMIETKKGTGDVRRIRFTLNELGQIESIRTEHESDTVITVVRRDAAPREEKVSEATLFTFDSLGRLASRTSDPDDNQPERPGLERIHWSDDTHAVIGDEQPRPDYQPLTLEFDEHGVLKTWIGSWGEQPLRLRNAAEYDARGNWVRITTSAVIDPAKPDELKPMFRYTRTIEYFDEAKDQKPAGN